MDGHCFVLVHFYWAADELLWILAVRCSFLCNHLCVYLSLNSERSEMWTWIQKTEQHLIFSRAMAVSSSLQPSNPSQQPIERILLAPSSHPPLKHFVSMAMFSVKFRAGKVVFFSKAAVKLTEVYRKWLFGVCLGKQHEQESLEVFRIITDFNFLSQTFRVCWSWPD